MICLKEISKTFFKNTPNEIRALEGVSLEFPKGEFAILIGANGSGKSTLLNAIAGTIGVDKGEIIFEQNKVNALKDYSRSRWIARIFQNPLAGTAPDLSILDNFRLAALRTRKKTLQIGITTKFRRNVQEKIALLGMGLENKLEQKMGALSGGQRQALTLIMAVMDEAKILLMDEPTAALDPKSAVVLMEKAQEIINEFQLTALLVTHDLRDAHHYGNRLIQMKEGRVWKDLDASEKSTLSQNELFEWFV